ncbi:MAG TPA: hypothetical protein VMK12_22940 [Anaeromyxobacteraceae bacterium]|nr:hypothetical protein [Anaeromyxobacteraceae bacterium]
MAEAEERKSAKRGDRRSPVLFGAVLLLLGLVCWLLAERNARRWALIFDDGTLSVKRGILFPVGFQPFRTEDPGLAQAYAPIRPPPSARLDEERVFDDRAGLDQALFALLAGWARDDIATERQDAIERAQAWLERADKLANISAIQRKDLATLHAESGFFEARQLVQRANETLRQALERLRLNAGSSSSHAGDSGEALRHVEPALEELYRAGRLLLPSAGRPPAPNQTAPPAAPPAPNMATATPAQPDAGRR